MQLPQSSIILIKRFCLIFAILCFSLDSTAHPDDEFCDQTNVDVQLCSQLAELDRVDLSVSALPPIELDRSAFETFSLYTLLGIDHILPWGLDHLAFVLALILAVSSLRTLLIQISVFTVAHSVTLVLGVLGMVSLNSTWVEVTIALSIVYVALENLIRKNRLAWRSAVVFTFGLLHGLGFAGALSEMGIPDFHYAAALIGFNVGIEIGQLLFGLAVFSLLHKLVEKEKVKRLIFVSTNCIIAAVGLFWMLERLP